MKLKLFILCTFLISPLIHWAQLSNGQLVHYAFDGNSLDQGVWGAHATEVGNPSYQANAIGMPGKALYLNGSSQRIDLPASNIIRPNSFPVTFSFWFNVPSFGTYGQKAFNTNFNTLSYNGFYCNIRNSEVEISYGDGGGTAPSNRRSFFINHSYQTNTWYHIIISIESPTQASAWINCQAATVSSSGSGGSINYGSSPGHIGMGRTSTASSTPLYYQGFLDEFRMWNRLLTSSERSELCNPCTTEEVLIADTICQGETFVFNGQPIGNPGQYTTSSTNIYGCDSTTTLQLSQTSVNTNVVQSGFTLTASIQADAWQWINCEDGQLIAGANGPSFTATTDGFYGVVITENGCTDTSQCFNIFGIGLREEKPALFNAYPNPHRGKIQIDYPQGLKKVRVLASDMLGRIVLKTEGSAEELMEIPLPPTSLILHIWGDEEYLGSQLLLH